MNTEEIASLCSALSIIESESPVGTLDVSLRERREQGLTLCLVGKILVSKLVNKDVFMGVMSRVWKVQGGFEIEMLEGNTFALHFRNAEDRRRILRGGPWNFDRSIIVFEESTGNGEIVHMRFNRIEFWVQIHNIPLLCMSEEIGVFLGKMIGEVREVDCETAKTGAERFLRVRVAMAVNEPLKRSLRVDLMGDGVITIMLLRYERLMDYCFKCVRLGHLLGNCPEEGDNKAVTTEGNLRLCVWLRAISPSKRFNYGRGRAGQKDWGKNNGGDNGGFWNNKYQKNSELKSGDQWRRERQNVGDRRLVGNSEHSKTCMGAEEEFNVPHGEDVHGSISSEYLRSDVTDGKGSAAIKGKSKASCPLNNSITDLPRHSRKAQSGIIISSGNLEEAQSSYGPMKADALLRKDKGALSQEPNLVMPISKNPNSGRWKRAARDRRLETGVGDLGIKLGKRPIDDEDRHCMVIKKSRGWVGSISDCSIPEVQSDVGVQENAIPILSTSSISGDGRDLAMQSAGHNGLRAMVSVGVDGACVPNFGYNDGGDQTETVGEVEGNSSLSQAEIETEISASRFQPACRKQ